MHEIVTILLNEYGIFRVFVIPNDRNRGAIIGIVPEKAVVDLVFCRPLRSEGIDK